MKVKIPFKQEFRSAMLSDAKTATSRTKRYGKAGDTFDAFGQTFEILQVSKVSLRFVANEYYLDEGCTSDLHFIRVWREIHPRKGFQPDQMVWLHEFKRVEHNNIFISKR